MNAVDRGYLHRIDWSGGDIDATAAAGLLSVLKLNMKVISEVAQLLETNATAVHLNLPAPLSALEVKHLADAVSKIAEAGVDGCPNMVRLHQVVVAMQRVYAAQCDKLLPTASALIVENLAELQREIEGFADGLQDDGFKTAALEFISYREAQGR